MPIAFEGAPTPLNIVFGILAAVLPAALGFVVASALVIGNHEISAIEIVIASIDFPLFSIDGDSCQIRYY